MGFCPDVYSIFIQHKNTVGALLDGGNIELTKEDTVHTLHRD